VLKKEGLCDYTLKNKDFNQYQGMMGFSQTRGPQREFCRRHGPEGGFRLLSEVL
jgi:hypothetical protein